MDKSFLEFEPGNINFWPRENRSIIFLKNLIYRVAQVKCPSQYFLIISTKTHRIELNSF